MTTTIIDTIKDPALFKPWFRGSTWKAWIVFLKALSAIEMTEAELQIFQRHTQREIAEKNFREAWLIVGRRGGKSLISALVAVYLACFRDYTSSLAPGEMATVMLIAADRRQARVVMRYITGFLEGVPMLRELIKRRTRETVELSNHVVIEVHTASFRSTRGYSMAAVICDEIAFWRSDESATPDKEILIALRPGLATIPGSLLLCISSPYARRGALWETYRKHYGKEDSILVWQATTREMNPTIDTAIIDQALEDDPLAAAAEYLAQFRRDVEGFVSLEVVEQCTIHSRIELPPSGKHIAFVDPSGGQSDSFTLAVAHREKDVAVLDCLREVRPPFSPENVTKEFAELLKTYKIRRVHGDRYAGEWPREQFRKHGIEYKPAEKSKSEIYLELLPMLNSGKVELLDHPRMRTQLLNLERRTSRAGKDSIDHAPNAHDDLINAAAGALLECRKASKMFLFSGDGGNIITGSDDIPKASDTDRILQRSAAQQQAFLARQRR
jgi:hypothetical protein